MRNEKRDGCHKTEVGWIPSEWVCDRLSEHTSKIGSGVTPNGGEAVYKSQIIPFIRSQNILIGEFTKKGLAYISSDIHDEMKNSKVIPGDVLYNITGASIGRCCLFPQDLKEANVNQHVCIIRPTRELTPDFLMQVLNSSLGERQLYQSQAGGGRQGLNYKNLGAFYMPFPSFDEQHKISQILSTWDRAIEQVQRLIEAKQRQKKGLMQGLLTGRLRFPEFGEPAYKKDEIPNGWSLVRLNQISSLKAGGTPSTFVPQYWGGYIPWMNSGELNLKFVNSVNGRITESGMKNSNTSMVPMNSVLVGLAGQGKTRGTVAVNKIPLCTNQSIAAIMPKEQRAHYLFLYYNLDFRYQELRRMSAGDGGRGGLTLSILGNMHVALPKIEEQLKISQCLFLIDQNILVLESKKQMINRQKEGLMQKLLTGEIRVKVD